MIEYRPTIAVDFDGVIHAYRNGWQGGVIYDEPAPGAAEALARLAERYVVAVFTAREDLDAVEAWLEKYGMRDLVAYVTNRKPQAVAYIDDRAVHHTSWEASLGEVEARYGPPS